MSLKWIKPVTIILAVLLFASSISMTAYCETTSMENHYDNDKITALVYPVHSLDKITVAANNSPSNTMNKASKTPTIPLKNPPLFKEDQRKSFAIMIKGNTFIPKYDQRIDLFVATAAGKPALKPVKPRISSLAPNEKETKIKKSPAGPIYTPATSGAFIDQNGDRKRWFGYILKNATGAVKVMWQVSTVPFSGSKVNWKNPEGLVSSGQVAATAGEFMVDFGRGKYLFSTITGNKSTIYKPISQGQKYYYVRAFPLNSTGNPIGDPGEGLAVIYGKPASSVSQKHSTSAELWTPYRTGLGDYGSENNDKPKKFDSVTLNAQDPNGRKLFCFQKLEASVSQVLIQVSDTPFTGNERWPSNKKLLYEKAYNTPVADSEVPLYVPRSTYPVCVVVPFKQFAMKAADMVADKFMVYYVRGVVVKPSSMPGTVDVSYTNTIRINYGFGNPVTIYTPPAPKYRYIDKALPNIRLKSYTPVKWASSDYLQHYYVFRKPTADEIKCCWQNVETKEILYPYDDFFGKPYYAAQGYTTKKQYEDIVIPRVLKVNSKVYFVPPTPKDEEWYKELYDMFKEFFEDLIYVSSEIANQVSSSYNNLKSGLINSVVSLCPIESLKGAFKTALEGLVNYGLVAVGLPPTLPNFDELSSMSLDYLAEIALTEAGIPESDLTAELTTKIAGAIGNEIQKASNHADKNPIDAAFLKLDPEYSYRPAYVDVELSNNSPVATVPGSFNLNVTFEFDNFNKTANSYDPNAGIFYSSPNPYIVGSSPALSTSAAYINHFERGLNGNTVNFLQGEKAVYDVFLPVIGQKVPILQPKEVRTVRVYLSPYALYGGGTFSRYPTGDVVQVNDFDVMYSNGNKKFNNFYLTGFFPTAPEYLNSQGKTYIQVDPNEELLYKYGGSTSDSATKTTTSIGWSR